MKNVFCLLILLVMLNFYPVYSMADDSDVSFDSKTGNGAASSPQTSTASVPATGFSYKGRIEALKTADSWDKGTVLSEISQKSDLSGDDQIYLVQFLQEYPPESYNTVTILKNLLQNSALTMRTKQLISDNLSKFGLSSFDQTTVSSALDNNRGSTVEPQQTSSTQTSSFHYTVGTPPSSGESNSSNNTWEWFLGSLLAIWVVWDASNIGVKRGQVPGFPDYGPIGWFFLTFCCWCIGFPFYIVKRKKYIEANKQSASLNQPLS